ncbi:MULTISPECIES: hypothetical protein [unclassified Duganella]|uniref:hypothetical protein n=1 Tax=unclassified Duganella TaxID=2636909 RepID=UPI0011C1AC07|nr:MULTISPECIES: hypothetical protein [unclassified Duganella]
MFSLLVLVCNAASADARAPASDPQKEMAEQRAALVELLDRGESRANACSIVAQRFSLSCAVSGNDFILTRGIGTQISYLATLRIPAK